MSIQKRTYKTKNKRGETVTRTAYRVRWIDADGKHRSKQFAYFVDAKVHQGTVDAGHSLLPIHRAKSSLTLNEFWKEWLATHDATLRSSTIEGYEQIWKSHIAPTVGERPMTEFEYSSRVISHLVNEMKRSGANAPTIRKAVQIVKRTLDFAVDWQVIDRNSARLHRLGKTASAKRHRQLVMFSAHEVERMRTFLLARADTGNSPAEAERANIRAVAILSIAAYAGLRPAEIFGLRWGDFDADKGELHIRVQVVRGEVIDVKSRRSVRDIPLITPLINDIQQWKDATGKVRATDPMFPSPSGRFASERTAREWPREIFKSACAHIEKHGDPVPYDLRHSFCMSMHYSSGLKAPHDMNLLEAARIAGHETETAARFYLTEPLLAKNLELPTGVTFEDHVHNVRRASGISVVGAANSARKGA